MGPKIWDLSSLFILVTPEENIEGSRCHQDSPTPTAIKKKKTHRELLLHLSSKKLEFCYFLCLHCRDFPPLPVSVSRLSLGQEANKNLHTGVNQASQSKEVLTLPVPHKAKKKKTFVETERPTHLQTNLMEVHRVCVVVSFCPSAASSSLVGWECSYVDREIQCNIVTVVSTLFHWIARWVSICIWSQLKQADK